VLTMRHIIITIGGGAAAPILVLFLLVACNPSKPAPTDDATTLCVGRCGVVNGAQCGPCEYGYTCNEAQYCVEIAGNDSDGEEDDLSVEMENDDYDLSPDTDFVATSDTDGNPWENIDCAEAPEPWKSDDDPYADRDILYRYYGDFDVVVKDPEGVRNLWAEKFTGLDGGTIIPCNCFWQTPTDACADNFPFEPVITEISPSAPTQSPKDKVLTAFVCDELLTPPMEWQISWVYGRDPKYNARNGKVLFPMRSPHAMGLYGGHHAYLLDISKRQLLAVTTGYSNAYFNGRYAFMTIRDMEKNYDFPDKSGYESVPWSEFIYYDSVEHKYGYAWYGEKFYFARSIHASDTHIIFSYQKLPDTNEGSRTFYARIGEWNTWKELTFMVGSSIGVVDAGFPSMVGQYVAFYNWDVEVAFCDLEKGDAGCFKVSRDNENGRMPKILDNKAVYYAAENKTTKARSLVKADITNPQDITYTTLVTHEKVLTPDDIDKDFLLYGKEIGERSNGDPLIANCFYRFSDGKSFCMDDPGHDAKIPTDYSYLPGGHYVVYQSWYDLVLRDMECYCDQFPSRCPYNDYTPKPRPATK